jgi:5-methylcytosine-specific restriction endonuclease McrA
MREINWRQGLRELAWYVHISYRTAPTWRPDGVGGWWLSGHRLEVGRPDKFNRYRYDPDTYVGKWGAGLREDAAKDLAEAAGKCVACGREPASDDHIVAKNDRFAAGDDSLWNFLSLCRSCNSSKGSRDLLEWTLDRFGRAFWMEWTEEQGGFVVGGGALRKPIHKPTDKREGFGRNALRLYLFSRWSALEGAGIINARAPEFLGSYLFRVEEDCRVPNDVVAAVRSLSAAPVPPAGMAAEVPA